MKIPVIISASNLKIRALIKEILISDDNINILAECSSAKKTLELVFKYTPSIIVMGERLTDSTSYEAIINIMNSMPTKILIITCKEIDHIKVDYPRALDYSIVGTIQVQVIDNKIVFPRRIITHINIMAKLNIEKFQSQIRQINEFKPKTQQMIAKQQTEGKRIRKIIKDTALSTSPKTNFLQKNRIEKINYKEIIVIGASTGGPRMLVYVVSQFPPDFPPVLLVQHMPPSTLGPFAARLNDNARINVKLARENDVIESGTVYVAPGDYHMEISKLNNGQNVITLSDSAEVNFVKPAVDVTLFSAARIYKNNTISVILTGMGHDGREGSRIVKKLGGKVLALREADSVVFGMNKSVIEAGLAHKILGMDAIVKEIALIINYERKKIK